MSQLEMNEEDKLYDEFGNYIGPDLSDNDSDDSSSSNDSDDDDWNEFAAHDTTPQKQSQQMEQDDDDNNNEAGAELNESNIQSEFETSNQNTMQLIAINGESKQNEIVLHEDKEYYKSAQDVYGDDVEIQIEEEDTQPLEVPIIAPIKEECFELIESSLPKTSFNYKFMAGLMDLPALIRNIAFIGHLHHGKTSFIDMLVKETHIKYRQKEYDDHIGNNKKGKNDNYAMLRYTDVRKDEQDRGISIKSCPISLVLPDLRGKHWLINCIDVPGHVNFSDEMTASLRLVDGAVIVVDCAEGVLLNTKRSIIHALEQNVQIVLVLNKLDRLIIELRLPPKDAYLKLVHTLSEVNEIIFKHCSDKSLLLDPIKGNVCFASSWFNWSFSLRSFAKIYSDYHQSFDFNELANNLWGDRFYDAKQCKFVSAKNESQNVKKRSFVQFILEPLYKIYAHTLGSDATKLFFMLSELGISLKKKELKLDAKPLLSLILSKLFGQNTGFVSMIIEHIYSPIKGAKAKILRNYCGNLKSQIAKNMILCNSSSSIPCMVNVTKMFSRPNGSQFDAFGRVFCGCVKVGDEVKIFREGYSPNNEDGDAEDFSIAKIEKIWIYQGRYRVEINQVKAGNFALFGGNGINLSILKTATFTHTNAENDCNKFRKLSFNTCSVCKVAIEPIKPSELPKMTHGLRCIAKSYPLCLSKVEESGEHILFGTGELYFDCLLYDLRCMYSQIEIKVSDPLVSFCETVDETSSMQCFALSKNKQNKLTMICEQLSDEIVADIENDNISDDISSYFSTKHGWDLMASRNIWAFGPDKNGPNILCDDTLPSQIDKNELNKVKKSIICGFEWATREGPLCDEAIRNCKFKLIDAKISSNDILCGGGQIIPTARRLVYSSFMLSNPRLMEPMLFVEIMCPPDCISAIEDVVSHRRGRILDECAKAGTPFHCVYAELPAIDSFGFETDLRSHTHGQAFCLQVFNRWNNVPGDPMDESIVLMPLEPHPPHKLAREFMIKTRKRKGLSENVTYHKFFDDEMMKEFAKLYDD